MNKCPVCQSPLQSCSAGEYCSNELCGYVDGIDFGPRPPKREYPNNEIECPNCKKVILKFSDPLALNLLVSVACSICGWKWKSIL